MIFWILATTIMLAVLGALYYAARGEGVNAPVADANTAMRAHFGQQLVEIESAVAAGRMEPAEASAAKSELAREVMHLETEGRGAKRKPSRFESPAGIAGLLAIAVVTFGLYAIIGNPGLPSMPLASRPTPQAASLDVDSAIEQVEAHLATNADDARGWAVIGPIYMRMGRYDDAAKAFRHVIALTKPTADNETDLAEALMMANGGATKGEPLELLKSAAALDPNHVRSRFYLAGEALNEGHYQEALDRWRRLLSLGNGDEPWMSVARDGVAAAEAGLKGEPVPAAPGTRPADSAAASADTGTVADTMSAEQQQMIGGMVEGLDERLKSEGGSVAEWQRLVRSRLVLGQREKAQAAYDAAKTAFPDPADRSTLDAMARGAGLE